MKQKDRNRDALRILMILGALSFLGLSHPYGSSSWFDTHSCYIYADSLELSFARDPRGKVDSILNLGMEGYLIIEPYEAGSFWPSAPESSMVTRFLLNPGPGRTDSTMPYCDPDHPHGYNAHLDTLYRKAFMEYFWWSRWPMKSVDTWKAYVQKYIDDVGNKAKYVEIINCLTCCHRLRPLMWLAFGFGVDTSLHGQDSLNYLHKEVRFGQEPNDTVVVIDILPDSFIHSINPSWSDPLTEDGKIISGDSVSGDSLFDTLCVYMVYLKDSSRYRKDTFYMTIPYELKKEIIGVGDRLGYWSPEWCFEHLIKPVEEHKPQPKPLTSHYAYPHNLAMKEAVN